MLQKRFRDAKEMLNELIQLGILKHENRHDKVEIEFLNIQYDLLSEKRKLRQIAGSKGGNAKAMLKQKGSYKDKDNNKDNNKDKYNAKAFLCSLGFDEKLIDEWFVIRKNKKLTNTETAIQGFIKEVEKTGCEKNEILRRCVENSWGGFKSTWTQKQHNPESNKPIINLIKSIYGNNDNKQH